MNPLIQNNFSIFNNLLSNAEFYLHRSDLESAITYCQIAAEFAWRNHCGIFSSSRLERILQKISLKSIANADKQEKIFSAPKCVKKVLHVMTEAYTIGGHTRMVQRWISIDRNRIHSVLLTRQGIRRIPEELLQAIKQSGGQFFRADHLVGGWLSRARVLKQAMSHCDAIILHTHPYDVLPMLGIPPEGNRPPVILMNHADHSFWIGVSLSDAIAHFRHSGFRLSVTRRGIDPDRSIILPIPLDPLRCQVSRENAKKALMLSEQNVVLLSIASAYKYRCINHPNFLEATMPIIRNCPNAVLLIVGPKSDSFPIPPDSSIRSRVQFYGRRSDNFNFYPAADIYLDSLPFSSITSLLEAGYYGLPLVSLCYHAKDSEVLCADAPGLDDCLLRFSAVDGYQKAIIDLIKNPEYRQRIGTKTQNRINAIHVQSWSQLLENLYFHILSCPRKEKWKKESFLPETTDLDESLLNFHRYCGIGYSLNKITRAHYRFMPFKIRFVTWTKTIDHISRIYPDFIFPEWFCSLFKNFVFNLVRRLRN